MTESYTSSYRSPYYDCHDQNRSFCTISFNKICQRVFSRLWFIYYVAQTNKMMHSQTLPYKTTLRYCTENSNLCRKEL